VFAQSLDMPGDLERSHLLQSDLGPIRILARMHHLQHAVLANLRLVEQRRNFDVEDRKDEIGAPEHELTLDKGAEFELAMLARDRARRDDGDEKSRLGDGFLDLVFPKRPMRDRGGILPQADIPTELHAQLAVNARPQARQRATGMLVVAARIAEEPDEVRK